MARPRNTTATQRQKAAPPAPPAPPAPAEPDPRVVPDHLVAMLVETGWVEDDLGRWSHETKSAGNPLPIANALEFEQRSRANAEEPQPRDDHGNLIPSPDAFEQSIRDSERDAAEAAELAAATITIEPEPEDVPVHDQIGRVMFWSCYQCKYQVRYSPQCHCEVCDKITEGVCCPRCGDNEPNLQRRR